MARLSSQRDDTRRVTSALRAKSESVRAAESRIETLRAELAVERESSAERIRAAEERIESEKAHVAQVRAYYANVAREMRVRGPSSGGGNEGAGSDTALGLSLSLSRDISSTSADGGLGAPAALEEQCRQLRIQVTALREIVKEHDKMSTNKGRHDPTVLWREKAFKVLVLNASQQETINQLRADRASQVQRLDGEVQDLSSQLRLARAAASDAEAQARLESSKARSAESAIRRADSRAEERCVVGEGRCA